MSAAREIRIGLCVVLCAKLMVPSYHFTAEDLSDLHRERILDRRDVM